MIHFYFKTVGSYIFHFSVYYCMANTYWTNEHFEQFGPLLSFKRASGTLYFRYSLIA